MPVADGDYRKRLAKKKVSLAKAGREKAFSSAPPNEPMKPWLGLPGTDKFPWQAGNMSEAIGSGLLGIGGVALSKLMYDPKRATAMANRDRLVDPNASFADKATMGNDDPMNRMLMDATMPGGGVAGPTRKVFGEVLDEAAKRAEGVTTRYSDATVGRLGGLVDEGLLSKDLLEGLSMQPRPQFERVRQAAEEAGVIDLPVFSSIAELPRRGNAVIGESAEPAVRQAGNIISLPGRLLGAEFPGSTSAKGGYDPAALEQNAKETILRGERLFGDLADETNPMRMLFYPMVNRGFISPVSKATGLSEDVITQLGSSFSPLKEVPMEMAQAAELAKRLGTFGFSADIPTLTKGMREMGLGQLLQSHTKNALKVIDKPNHTAVTPQNIKKITMYALNKAQPTVEEAAGLPAYTFDTWQRRAMGFADDALPAPGRQYANVITDIAKGAQSAEAISALERQLRAMGYSVTAAKKMAKIPNIGQATVWSDARNQIGDVVGRMFG